MSDAIIQHQMIPYPDSSDANATAANILKDKTAYVNNQKVTGTMTNQGAKTSALNCGDSYTIPAGYHNGSGKITANTLASQTDATATAASILSGKTAWVKGVKLTGTATSGYTKISSSNAAHAAGSCLSGYALDSCTMSGNQIDVVILLSAGKSGTARVGATIILA